MTTVQNEEPESGEEDYYYDSEGMHILDDSDEENQDEDEVRQPKIKVDKFPQFHEKVQYGHVKFEVGMVFPNLDAFKKVVKDYAVYEGKPIKLPKNDKVRCRAIYFEPCPWKLLCSWSKDIQSYQIKTFNDVHTCCRVSRI